MSSSQPYHASRTASLPSAREDLPVYRCCDTHWHFVSHKNDHKPHQIPWYRQLEYPDAGKYPVGTHPIYVQGGAGEHLMVYHKYVSGFYELRVYGGEVECCEMGRTGKWERKLWREEEMRDTPWSSDKKEVFANGDDAKMPSSSSSGPSRDGRG